MSKLLEDYARHRAEQDNHGLELFERVVEQLFRAAVRGDLEVAAVNAAGLSHAYRTALEGQSKLAIAIMQEVHFKPPAPAVYIVMPEDEDDKPDKNNLN